MYAIVTVWGHGGETMEWRGDGSSDLRCGGGYGGESDEDGGSVVEGQGSCER